MTRRRADAMTRRPDWLLAFVALVVLWAVGGMMWR